MVDIFHRVESLPTAGQKGYFQNATEPISAKLVGGVTLNHLCWARLLGVNTSVLALEGNDENGQLIRSTLDTFNVGTDTISISDSYCTSVSHIFLDSMGERCIMMAPGSTSQITKDVVYDIFSSHFHDENVCLFSTEISQVPLEGVLSMLTLCNELEIPSIIDVDVPPSVAMGDANLGEMHQLIECLERSTVIKPTLEAALELLALEPNQHEIANNSNTPNLDHLEVRDVAKQLKSRFVDSAFIAITNGKKGAVMATNHDIVTIEPLQNIQQIDSTGAGDAFFGGIIAGIYHFGIPQNADQLRYIGDIAKCTGAASVEVLGALPHLPVLQGIDDTKSSMERVVELNGDLKVLMDRNPIPIKNPIINQNDSNSTNSTMNSISTDCKALTALLDRKGLSVQIEGMVDEMERAQRVFVTGMGKSGIVAQRMAASLSSIGYDAEFVNGADWVHGDIGKLRIKEKERRNVVIVLSVSGKTKELWDAMEWIGRQRVSVKEDGMVSSSYNTTIFGVFCIGEENVMDCKQNEYWMGDVVDEVVYLGKEFREMMDCVPSRSIIVQEAFVNAVMTVLHDRNATKTMDAFPVNHPGGSIGKALKGA